MPAVIPVVLMVKWQEFHVKVGNLVPVSSTVSNKDIWFDMCLQLVLFYVLDSATVVSNCSHGDIRLTAVTQNLSGKVELCVHGIWGAVCNHGWDTEDANVACKQLGFLSYGKTFITLKLM